MKSTNSKEVYDMIARIITLASAGRELVKIDANEAKEIFNILDETLNDLFEALNKLG